MTYSVTHVKHASEGIRQAARDMVADGYVFSGFYKIQLVRKSIWSPVRIWRGFGWEPGTHHYREVIYIWRALLNSKEVPLLKVWPACSWYPITRGEYFYRLALFRHAVTYEPHLPEASPYERVDFSQLRFTFATEGDHR